MRVVAGSGELTPAPSVAIRVWPRPSTPSSRTTPRPTTCGRERDERRSGNERRSGDGLVVLRAHECRPEAKLQRGRGARVRTRREVTTSVELRATRTTSCAATTRRPTFHDGESDINTRGYVPPPCFSWISLHSHHVVSSRHRESGRRRRPKSPSARGAPEVALDPRRRDGAATPGSATLFAALFQAPSLECVVFWWF